MPNAILLYSKPSCVTGKALAEALEIDSARRVRNLNGYDTILRWGSSLQRDLDNTENVYVYNRAGAVSQIVNREHMIRSIGSGSISSLSIYRTPQVINSISGYTVVRGRFGRLGRDVQFVSNTDRERWQSLQSPENDLFSVEHWPADYEVRVHIVDGKSIAFQIKTQVDENGEPTYETPPRNECLIRNIDNGWNLFPLSSSLATELGISKSEIRERSKTLIRNLGLNYGVVDFLLRISSTDNYSISSPQVYRVLEVNTSPGLSGSAFDSWVAALRQLLERREEEPDEFTEDEEQEPNPYENQFTDDMAPLPPPLEYPMEREFGVSDGQGGVRMADGTLCPCSVCTRRRQQHQEEQEAESQAEPSVRQTIRWRTPTVTYSTGEGDDDE